MEIGQYEPTKKKSATIMPSKIGMKCRDELVCIAGFSVHWFAMQ
jgi:hypothetical protein